MTNALHWLFHPAHFPFHISWAPESCLNWGTPSYLSRLFNHSALYHWLTLYTMYRPTSSSTGTHFNISATLWIIWSGICMTLDSKCRRATESFRVNSTNGPRHLKKFLNLLEMFPKQPSEGKVGWNDMAWLHQKLYDTLPEKIERVLISQSKQS